MRKTVFALLFTALVFSPSLLTASERLTVIFDQGHGQAFLANKDGTLQLSNLGRLFAKEGFDVMYSPGRVTPNLLSKADVFIVSGPFAPYTKEEAGAVYAFVKAGGRLAVMAHISWTVTELINRFGVSTTNGTIVEIEKLIDEKGKSFHVSHLSRHPLTSDIKHFSVYGVWGLDTGSKSVKAVARTSPSAFEDHDDDGKRGEQERSGPFGMVVAGKLGKGRFVVFGDDTMFQNKYLKDENLTLARNLVKWLKKD